MKMIFCFLLKADSEFATIIEKSLWIGGSNMPIYEYECTHCGQVEEVIQKFTDSPLTTCKKCSGRLHKLISHSSFHLKGTGWYVTDYASGNNKSAASTKPAEGTPSPPKPEASASTDNKSDN